MSSDVSRLSSLVQSRQNAVCGVESKLGYLEKMHDVESAQEVQISGSNSSTYSFVEMLFR